MCTLELLEEKHRKGVIDVFNYYVENSNAAFPQVKVDYSVYDTFLENARILKGYAIIDDKSEIIGFCQLKPYRPGTTFEKTVEVTYFLAPTATRKGIGKKVLEQLINDAVNLGKKHILASISGDNEASIKFHSKNGFCECGRFKDIGTKFGKNFDIVYMQRNI